MVIVAELDQLQYCKLRPVYINYHNGYFGQFSNQPQLCTTLILGMTGIGHNISS